MPTAAITLVGVLPTHCRRGIAKRLMEGLVVQSGGRGRMLASLRGSEAVIYPRYGFGVAGENASAVIDTRRARPLRCPEIEGSFGLLARDAILDIVPALYAHGGCGAAVSRSAVCVHEPVEDVAHEGQGTTVVEVSADYPFVVRVVVEGSRGLPRVARVARVAREA